MAFKPELEREGDAYSRLFRLMQTFGYNDGGLLRSATITSDYPNISIRPYGESIDIPTDGIVVNPDLIKHTETVKINGISTTIEYPNKLVTGARVWVFEDGDRQVSYVLMMNND